MKNSSFFSSKTFSLVLIVVFGGILTSFTMLPHSAAWPSLQSFFNPSYPGLLIGQSTNSLSMNFDYEKAWKEIDSLEQQGLPKSALDKTEVLLGQARQDGKDAQLIKALIYRGKYQSQLEEYGLPKAIYRFEQEIAKTNFPVKPILQSMLAEMYSHYLSNNQWQIQDRTQTAGYKSDDIETWTTEQLVAESARLYRASIEDDRLKNTALDDFKILIEEGKNNEGLRPTLYDFLAHRAIDYFMNEQSYLTQPAYKFDIESEKAFAPAAEFADWKIDTRDTSSQKYLTLLLFQDLLQFRMLEKRKHSPSLLDANLKRLSFVHNNSIRQDKDELYLSALDRLIGSYSGNAGAAEVMHAKASLLYSIGSNYNPAPMGVEDTDERKWHFKKALELCNEAIEKYPGSYGAGLCRQLVFELQQKSLELTTELVNLPEKPILAKIDYRNLQEVWLKVIRFDEKRRDQLEKIRQEQNAQQETLRYFNNLKPVRKWSANLPDDGDLRRHSIEVKIDELPLGQYLVMISGSSDFEKSESSIGYLFTNVSKIGYWQREGQGTGSEFIVFDRESGTPTKGVKAEFWVRNYNSVFRKYDWKNRGTASSNGDGFISTQLSDREDRNFRLLLRHAKDTLFTDQHYYNNTYRDVRDPYQQTRFFLDRAIYRPGQTVYFKGIALSFDENRMPSIIRNEKVTVTFRDANYQETASMQLRSNEFGTFNGQFVTPRGGLLGNMQIVSSIGGNGHSFRVEEYKRPKFEVKFEPVTGSYRLDDTVEITGYAQAYAGNNLDGAEVTWRVIREVRFPWLPYWYRSWLPWAGESMEIANGKATTDSKGKYTIEFKAIPDRSIPKDKKPEFSYTVYADITDITGETQSSETHVKVGYIAMEIDVPVGNQVHLDSLKKFTIATRNLNGEFEAAKGTFSLDLLDVPDQVFIERYWEKPDRQLMSKRDFNRNFPHYPYGAEDQKEKWEKERTVFSGNFNTATSKEVVIPKVKLIPGWYALTLKTEDSYGTPVELIKYFSLYNLEKGGLPAPSTFWHNLSGDVFEPGETAQLRFATTEKCTPVLLELEKDGKTLSRKWLMVENIKKEGFAVQEKHRGNVTYLYSFAKHNRSDNKSAIIQVPWSNKDLTLEFGTFRDKLQPGQPEEWTVKIKGPKGDKVAAEMVAGMYDASLDAFASNNWGLNVFPTSWSRIRYSSESYGISNQNWLEGRFPNDPVVPMEYRSYDRLNWFNWYFHGYYGVVLRSQAYGGRIQNGVELEVAEMAMSAAPANKAVAMDSAEEDREGQVPPPPPSPGIGGDEDSPVDFSEVKVRTNLNETVFFYPNLMTDEDGNVLIKFTMNEALTRWKFLGLAHTEDLKTGWTSKEVVTQKDLMVVPNPPRFFRENDEIEFTAKVVNLTDKPLSGNAQLQLVNPMESMPVYKWQDNPQFNSNFTVEANQSARLAWRFKVPDVADAPMIEHTVFAAAGDFSDAERNVAPVLSNRMLVTETKPLPVRGKETKGFVFESLKNYNSTTLRHQGLTLEFTQNPAWYAVQALPYLMEYPYECTEQIFARYYANSLATSVANQHPKIKAVFDKWRDYDENALLSNLSKNQELKTALLEETPWVLQAQSEEQQKQNIALLFDLNRMAYEQETALKKLQDRQQPGGGWAWFPGGRDSWYITQYIVEGLGHLQKLGVADIQQNPATWQMVEKAVRYCDDRIVEQYENLERMVKEGKTTWDKDHLDHMAAHYLYARSFFLEDRSGQASLDPVMGKDRRYIELNGKAAVVHDYYTGQAEKHWLNKGLYTEGMLALSLARTGKATPAANIVRSLKERSLNNEELGMYWKYQNGWWWYQAPIETHSLMIEVFSDVANDAKAVDDLKVWLLKNKQTTHWKTTKATALAVYALLSSGDNWLLDSQPLGITFGNPGNRESNRWTAEIQRGQSAAEAGTGYFKVRFDGDEVTKDMANIQVVNPNNVVAWGAMYWQYFEQLDKIETFKETPLTIDKQLFRVENSPTGEILKKVNEGDALNVGEKLKVRVELRVDRDMEYVHMKDMRASGFEPINVMSSYKWQGGLGYYESTRDASTNFFFSYLPKGTYVFEYPLRVVHNGEFSNGVTTIQCMYAPEFTSHSEGIRVVVK